MDSEAQADEVGQNGSCALLGADRGSVWRRGKGARERKTVRRKSVSIHSKVGPCARFEVARTSGRMGLRMAGFHVRDDVRAWMIVLATGFFTIRGIVDVEGVSKFTFPDRSAQQGSCGKHCGVQSIRP